MKAISVALLVAGIILLAYGINESNSFSSSVKQSVTGSPTDHSVALIVSGAAAAVLGLFGLLRKGD